MKIRKTLFVSPLRQRALLLLFILMGYLQASAVSLKVGESYRYTASIPSGWHISTGYWQSSNSDISVSSSQESCTVTPTKYFSGTATITGRVNLWKYDSNGQMITNVATSSFTVTCVKPGVSLSPYSVTAKAGDEVLLQLTFTNVYSSPGLSASWHSSDSRVADVRNAPSNPSTYESVTVATYKAGTCTITIDCGNNITASSTITVQNTDPTAVALQPDAVSLAIGETRQLGVVFTPSDASSTMTWSSNSTAVATVSSSGLVTAKGEGTARITGTTSNGLSASCEVTVYKPVLTAVQLGQHYLRLPIGDSYQLTYSTTPANAVYSTAVTWSSDNSSVAWVGSTGMVYASSAGTAHIIVRTDDGYSDQCEVTVPPLPVSISLPADITLTVHQQRQLACSVIPSDAQTSYSWSSSDKKVAMVSNTGLVTAVSVGKAVIMVTSENGLTATCQVTVAPQECVLVVWTKDGENMEYGFSEKPQITIQGDVFTVSSQTTTMEYAAKDIKRITIVQKNETDHVATPSVDKPRVQVRPDELLLVGCRPGSMVAVYTLGGQMVESRRTGSDGQLTVSLAGYARGVYMVKTETTSVKIIKK